MRLRFSNVSGVGKTLVAIVLLASLAGVGVAVAEASGAAASKTVSAPTTTTAAAAKAVTVQSTSAQTDAAQSNATAASGQDIVNAAAAEAGLPYCYGGGTYTGPTAPTFANPGCTLAQKGFDCMSLAQYAVYQVTGIKIPQTGNPDDGEGTYIPEGSSPETGLEPGDVTFWGGTNISSYAHSGVYAGGDEIWDAFDNNIPVGEHSFGYLEGSYGYDGAIRYAGSGSPPPPPPSFGITTTSLPKGTVYSKSLGNIYSATLHATGGNPPYKWSLVSGTLPAGLKLKSSGVISGKATTKETGSFKVEVVDTKIAKTATKPASQHSAEKTFSITIT